MTKFIISVLVNLSQVRHEIMWLMYYGKYDMRVCG